MKWLKWWKTTRKSQRPLPLELGPSAVFECTQLQELQARNAARAKQAIEQLGSQYACHPQTTFKLRSRASP